MSSALFQAFFSPVLAILLVGGLIVGLILAFLRKRPFVSTVAVVEAAALIAYVCVFLLILSPLVGVVASLVALSILAILWRSKFIEPDTNVTLFACVLVFCLLLLAS